MLWKILLLSLVGTASAMASPAALAEEIHLGKIVSVAATTLVMANEEGTAQQTFTVPMTVTVTLNGMPAKLDELTPGDFVQVVTETKDGTTAVTKVEAKSSQEKQP